jgi:AmmeMemoRadiSam system protein A
MRYDYFALQNLLAMGEIEACGGGPLVTTMMVAEQLGGTNASPVTYLHSGNTEAGKSRQNRVVGYFSGIIVKGKYREIAIPELSASNKARLLDKVEEVVKNVVAGKDTSFFFGMVPMQLAQYSSAFVTLKEHGKLRACMGHTFANNPLILEVQEAAKLAATSDYRFGAIKESEVDSLQFEITVMSRMRRILDFDEIEIGKDGLFIRLGSNRGLLLPQVAIEWNWDVKTFLENLCLKAGLQKNDYKNPMAQIYAFRALIIDEDDLED